MAFQLSPGVNVSEYSITTIIPAVGTTEGAFVGSFDWGPIDTIMQVSDELGLAAQVLSPDANTYIQFFTAANFLSYTNNLKLVRSGSSLLRNASANGAAPYIKNRVDYDANFSSGANTYGPVAARYPGAAGNSLKVSFLPTSNSATFAAWPYNGNFPGVPGTSSYVSNLGGLNDEMHIVVIDEDGRFTGIANTVLERYQFVSKASDAKNQDGTSNYYKNILNDKSKYIRWMAHPGIANSANWGSAALGTSYVSDNTTYTVSLTNGTYGLSTTGNVQTSYDQFKNPDVVDASLIMTGGHSNLVSTYIISNIAEVRKDVVVFISPAQTSVVNNYGAEAASIVTDRNLLTSSSYAFMDGNWKYQYDKYNDLFRWLPLNGDIAGVVARSDQTRDPWISPAGFNRGQIKNVTKLAWNPAPSDRDTLYNAGVNPVLTFNGQGTILYGDKTLLAKPDAFDRINVRRLFIVLEKAISTAAKFSLFEINDAFTRSQFVSLVEPFLRDVQGRRGIYDFKVVCDETNNTPVVIDANRFVGDIYIKPARSINYIQLNFVAVGTGVDFNVIVGKF